MNMCLSLLESSVLLIKVDEILPLELTEFYTPCYLLLVLLDTALLAPLQSVLGCRYFAITVEEVTHSSYTETNVLGNFRRKSLISCLCESMERLILSLPDSSYICLPTEHRFPECFLIFRVSWKKKKKSAVFITFRAGES